VSYESDADVQAKKNATLQAETIPMYLEKLEAIVKENNGYFALGKLTWADLYFTAVLDYMNFMAKKDLIADHPNLKNLVEKVLAIESIKAWVNKRPVTEL